MESKQMIKEWLDTVVGANDTGPISVKERIAYLVVCSGGYRPSDEIDELAGTKIGPFTLGLSLGETIEHAYYVGMLSGMFILSTDPFTILDLYIEEYITKSLAEYGMEIVATGIMEDGILNIKRLMGSYDHMNPEHKGDAN